MIKLKLIAFSPEIPQKFKWINLFILLPILLWPLVFFASIFIFDDPNANLLLTWALFFGVNLYPLYLIITFEINARLYKRIRIAAYVLPFSILGSLTYVFVKEYLSSKQFENEMSMKRQKRKEAGYIGSCDTYKIKNDSIFYEDIFINGDPKSFKYLSCSYAKDNNHVYKGSDEIVGCDPESFEIINNKWQKDNKYYYYFGEAMTYVDYNTFELLDVNYSRDKNHVYYYQRVLTDADPNTFQVNSMTHYATDKNYTFFRGEITTNH